MPQLSVRDFGSYFPERKLTAADFFDDGDPLANSAKLRAPDVRYHVDRDQRAGEMIALAARPMFERLGIAPETSVDIIITNVLLPDNPITGSGAEVAERLGCAPASILDLHNGGCASFPYMLKLASALMEEGALRTALLCTVQNGAGRLCALPEARKKVQSAVPGDGCGVAYVVAGENGALVLGTRVRNSPALASGMTLASSDGRRYWEPGPGEVTIAMDEQRLNDILRFGNEIVPALVGELCEQIGVKPQDIDRLVTNQPNRVYLENWHKALGLDGARHLDTFDQFGNLMTASIPVTLDCALRAGELADGDLIVMAGFAHAGDFASAAAVRWQTTA